MLLVITQVVDKNNPILGFFHRWIEELAKHYDSLIVICLYEGEHDLPENVTVLSLGKEEQKSRLQYLSRFFKYIWKYRASYQSVFVHMNQEYILLGGVVWKLLGKKIYLWRNHYSGSILTDLAAMFCRNVFCTSKHSYTAKYEKTVVMPVGVNTKIFTDDGSVLRKEQSILFLARMSPSKRPHILIDALSQINKQGISFTASFYGEAGKQDSKYYKSLVSSVNEQGLDKIVRFYGGISNNEAPQVYKSHEIFVNLSKSGMYDKTIFEALACGGLTLASSSDYGSVADDRLIFDGTKKDLVLKIQTLLKLSQEEKIQLRRSGEEIVKFNTLDVLVSHIVKLISRK